MTESQTNPTPEKPVRTLRMALIASLVVNLLLVGLIALAVALNPRTQPQSTPLPGTARRSVGPDDSRDDPDPTGPAWDGTAGAWAGVADRPYRGDVARRPGGFCRPDCRGDLEAWRQGAGCATGALTSGRSAGDCHTIAAHGLGVEQRRVGRTDE